MLHQNMKYHSYLTIKHGNGSTSRVCNYCNSSKDYFALKAMPWCLQSCYTGNVELKRTLPNDVEAD